MAEPAFIGAIDQGTTSTRFLLYDRHGKPVASHQIEFSQIYPQAGWVEHNPMEILETIKICMQETYDKAKAQGLPVEGNIKGIGITNQRETTLIWRKSNGLPLYNAIVWMDVRTSGICRRLEKELPEGRFHFVKTTGLPISTYFSATKLIWLLESVPEVKSAVEEGDALFGTIDTWLIWNLTRKLTNDHEVAEGGVHVTDCTNAARTLLMDLITLQWHQPSLDKLGIPAAILPRIISNSEYIGEVSEGWPLAGVPIAGCLGDQQAATLGQKCKQGEAKSTYGTGCFIVLNTGETIVPSAHGLLTTVAFKLGQDATTQYAIEGSIAIAGAAVQWLRDSLGIIKTAPEIEELANSVENTGGVYFVPAFNGLFAPWWKDDARGVMVGISRFTTKAHIARAVLESLCFQAKDVLTAMHSDASNHTSQDFVLRVDGGAAVNNLLMQLQADLLGSPVVRPGDIETTARGAAYAAGLTVGLWSEQQIFGADLISELPDGQAAAKTTIFHPRIETDEREKRHASWCDAVERSFGLADLC